MEGRIRMISKEEQKKKVELLQENLTSIRKIAGWSMQQLADEIGVSKQTVSNWEKDDDATPMNFTQYIAIRAVLDSEIVDGKNKVLGEVVAILLDSKDEVDEETYQKNRDKIKMFVATSGGLTGAALTAYFYTTVIQGLGVATATSATGVATSVLGAAAGITLGPLGALVGGAAALTSGLWLNKMRKKKK